MYWEADLPPVREGKGAYVFGFQVEGARWDMGGNNLEESEPKKQFSVVPVILCKAVLEGKEDKQSYQCPVYKTDMRGGIGFVFTAQLRSSKYPPAKWILAGVAMILDVEGVSDAFVAGKNPNAVGDDKK